MSTAGFTIKNRTFYSKFALLVYRKNQRFYAEVAHLFR